jgi:hypothetical protein
MKGKVVDVLEKDISEKIIRFPKVVIEAISGTVNLWVVSLYDH